MEHSRWGRLMPPALALVASLAAAVSVPGPAGAADPPWSPPVCAASPDHPIGRAWFRLDAVLDRHGSLVGRRLSVGDAVAASRRRVDLARESFATGPFADLVLVGSDDGRRSDLRLIDAVRSCATEIASEPDVVRSGLVTPDGAAIVEHRVDRRSRADLGVWRRALDGGAAERLLAPALVDTALGPTFATELAWGTDGRLAVLGCGEIVCRARVLDPTTGVIREIDDVGQLIGLTGGTLVTYRPCAGLPCAIERIELVTGRRSTLVSRAGLAVLAGPDRDQLVTEQPDGDRTVLHALDLPTGRTRDLGTVPSGMSLQVSAMRSGSGIASDALLALMPDGRVPLDVGRGDGRLVDAMTGAPAAIREVRR
jgi:hypothetical protein